MFFSLHYYNAIAFYDENMSENWPTQLQVLAEWQSDQDRMAARDAREAYDADDGELIDLSDVEELELDDDESLHADIDLEGREINPLGLRIVMRRIIAERIGDARKSHYSPRSRRSSLSFSSMVKGAIDDALFTEELEMLR